VRWRLVKNSPIALPEVNSTLKVVLGLELSRRLEVFDPDGGAVLLMPAAPTTYSGHYKETSYHQRGDFDITGGKHAL